MEQVCYLYDATFEGFLTCVYEIYVNHEPPAAFRSFDDGHLTLWPERPVEGDKPHALRVYRSLAQKVSPEFQSLVTRGFLTCLEDRELALYDLIALGYKEGKTVTRNLTAPAVARVVGAVRHLEGEAHLLRGFVRFSDQDGVLAGEIEPKNRVLPLLRTHFCTRLSGERFLLYDRTHKEALFYADRRWSIVPLEHFEMGSPSDEERACRALWRRFYDTIAIEGRYNPKCRMTQMPKRYWNTMTEFQGAADELSVCGSAGQTRAGSSSAVPRTDERKSLT